MTTKKTRALAEAVAQVPVLKPKLEAAADRLNTKITEFERVLKDLKLGVAASVPLWIDQEDFRGEDLQFCKWTNDWRLVVRSWETQDADGAISSKYELLQNSSREQRLTAVAQFPALVDTLIESAERELERVSSSANSIDALINSLKSGARP